MQAPIKRTSAGPARRAPLGKRRHATAEGLFIRRVRTPRMLQRLVDTQHVRLTERHKRRSLSPLLLTSPIHTTPVDCSPISDIMTTSAVGSARVVSAALEDLAGLKLYALDEDVPTTTHRVDVEEAAELVWRTEHVQSADALGSVTTAARAQTDARVRLDQAHLRPRHRHDPPGRTSTLGNEDHPGLNTLRAQRGRPIAVSRVRCLLARRRSTCRSGRPPPHMSRSTHQRTAHRCLD